MTIKNEEPCIYINICNLIMYVQRLTAGLHLYPYGRNIIINGIEFNIIKVTKI